MDCRSTPIPYGQIGYFSSIIIDYLNQSPHLQPFYRHPVSMEGIKGAIAARKQFTVNRTVLVNVLQQQYASVETSEAVSGNIRALAGENTFTIVTAHQPNIFTGYLYFIYKILHIIKLAAELDKQLPAYKFVPVFYMGSEDADLEELGKIFISGEKIVWDTKQTGAVGRMHPKGLDKIIERLEGELSIHPYGPELLNMVKAAYTSSPDMQTATLQLVNRLFAAYGLVVLIPDDASLKQLMRPVFEDDLLHQTPSVLVNETIQQLSAHEKVQAQPRDINLFYLKNNIRERIVKNGDTWKVIGHNIVFSAAQLMQELSDHPERFSPNVILRGLFQETILPNIAFIGGGGETAYWLELQGLFTHYNVPFPMLILRNSFLFIDKEYNEKINRLGLAAHDFFKSENRLMDELVARDSVLQLQLNNEISEAMDLYAKIKAIAGKTDGTLEQHVASLQTKVVNQLQALEKKMLRAEKRKFTDHRRQVHTIKEKLFPNNSLQERIDNFMPYYAKYGQSFITMLYENSPTLDQHFVVLTER